MNDVILDIVCIIFIGAVLFFLFVCSFNVESQKNNAAKFITFSVMLLLFYILFAGAFK